MRHLIDSALSPNGDPRPLDWFFNDAGSTARNVQIRQIGERRVTLTMEPKLLEITAESEPDSGDELHLDNFRGVLHLNEDHTASIPFGPLDRISTITMLGVFTKLTHGLMPSNQAVLGRIVRSELRLQCKNQPYMQPDGSINLQSAGENRRLYNVRVGIGGSVDTMKAVKIAVFRLGSSMLVEIAECNVSTALLSGTGLNTVAKTVTKLVDQFDW